MFTLCGVMLLTAAMEGFFPSPAGGWVTSAPRKITGCWNTNGLERRHVWNLAQKMIFSNFWTTADRCHISNTYAFIHFGIFTNLPCGRRMLLTPPSLTLIFRQRLERVWGVVFWTFFTCTHCVAIPSTVSPTRFTSAATHIRTKRRYRLNKHSQVEYWCFEVLLWCITSEVHWYTSEQRYTGQSQPFGT